MFIPSKIEQLIIDNKLTKKSFCEKVSISVQGLDNILKGADLGSSKLEWIADFFKLPIDYFFDRDINVDNSIGHHVNGNGNKVSGDITLSECKNELEKLRLLIKEKEERIKDKDEMIALLKQQLNK